VALAPGARLGAYEVIAPIGAGGMGEVYRARDTKLNRDVALKILPEAFTADGDRIARFRREAQVLASLNHPNIAHIYGFEDSGSTHALVLELVEGPTLGDRIAKGPIPLDEALPIAKQIAEALEAAHEQGIVHRDLKPANIKAMPDGKVKVLDFGLAKAMEPASAVGPMLTNSPTITTPAQMTGVGMILGTAAYMSPEQAKGRPADKRSDVWAFGCVLFEMLTSRRAFEGEDVSDTLAAVLRGEPDWTALPTDTPERIHGLLRRCLRRDAQKRLPHIAMARFEFDEVPAESPVPQSSPAPVAQASFGRRAMPVAIGIVLASALTSGVWWMLKPPPSLALVHRFALPIADGDRLAGYPFRSVAISRDGSQIAYVANERLYLRSMSSLVPTVIAGTDTGVPIGSPAFSPDGSSILFVSARRDSTGGATINTISVHGGVPTRIAQVRAGSVFGASWSDDGIVYGDQDAGILRISPLGGKPEQLVSLGSRETLQGPVMLPGGRAVLFALASGRDVGSGATVDLWDAAKIVVQTLPAGQRTTLIEGGSEPQYLPTGHLLYARAGTMYVAPFDPERLKVGPSSPILEGVARVVAGRTSTGSADFSVSSIGTIVYVPGPALLSAAQPKLAIVDRAGHVDALKVPPLFYERPRVSPRDSKQVAVGVEDSNNANIYIHDLSGKSSMRPLTFEGKNRFPIWSPDGTRVAYQSDREGDLAIFWQPSDGSAPAQRLTRPDKDTTHAPESWSSDGKYVLYSVSQGSMSSLWVYSFETKKGTAFGDVRSPRLMSPTFSPDGHWIAYTTTTGGQNQVFVQPFPATGIRYLVGSGARPQWSPDGKEIFFYRTDGTFVKTVTTHPSFSLSDAVTLPFNVYGGRGPGAGRDADIMPDGQHFIAVIASTEEAGGQNGIRQFQVMLNWFDELKQRVPTR
jgi:serine/threonine-protein kinase